MPGVLPLAERHARAVAKLHLEHLETPFRGTAGEKILTLHYRNLAAHEGGAAWVAELNGEVLGYCFILWNPSQVSRRLLRRFWPGLLWWGALQVLTRPAFLPVLIGALRGYWLRQAPPGPVENGVEFRDTVVVNQERGSGIAQEFAAAAEREARERGFKQMFGYVAFENKACVRWLEKAGWTNVGEVDCYDQPRLRLELSLEDPS